METNNICFVAGLRLMQRWLRARAMTQRGRQAGHELWRDVTKDCHVCESCERAVCSERRPARALE